MIVSHRYRFIFLRTEKTGSSSLRWALKQNLGPEDYCAELYRPGLRKYYPHEVGYVRRTLGGWLVKPHPHATAAQVRHFVGKEVWRSYFKFAVERNPWDRQVSLYCQRRSKSDTPQHFDRDMGSPLFRALHYTRLNNWGIYTIHGKIAVDRVIRYEQLDHALPALFEELGFEEAIELPRLRSGHREAGRDYRDYYSPKTRNLVAKWYRREIEAFGYTF